MTAVSDLTTDITSLTEAIVMDDLLQITRGGMMPQSTTPMRMVQNVPSNAASGSSRMLLIYDVTSQTWTDTQGRVVVNFDGTVNTMNVS